MARSATRRPVTRRSRAYPLIAATQEPADNSSTDRDQGDDGTGQSADLVGSGT